VIETAALARFGLLLVRPGVLVMTAPVFGGTFVPAPVRIGLGVLLAIVVAPIVPVPERGIAVGLRVLIAGAELAGYLAGFQIGLSYAAVVDPQSGVRNNVISTLYASLALVIFFGINGHHALIRALLDSYALIPVGGAGFSGSIGASVAGLLGMVFVIGLRLAAPVVTALLLVELALGLIARAAPSLNLMVVGAPVRLIAGFLALAVGVQAIPGVVAGGTNPVFDAAARLLRALG
jgi:flagellar biosynthetic protein FliR